VVAKLLLSSLLLLQPPEEALRPALALQEIGKDLPPQVGEKLVPSQLSRSALPAQPGTLPSHPYLSQGAIWEGVAGR
jgi:hypothetical protein